MEGIRGEQFSAGFYDMAKWEEYRRENERYVCEHCMFADPKICGALRLLLLTAEFAAVAVLSRRPTPAFLSNFAEAAR